MLKERATTVKRLRSMSSARVSRRSQDDFAAEVAAQVAAAKVSRSQQNLVSDRGAHSWPLNSRLHLTTPAVLRSPAECRPTNASCSSSPAKRWMGDDAYGINAPTIVRMVREVQEVTELGVEVAVVIGAANIFRGVAGGSVGMDRATADYMGMLATVMNALALADTNASGRHDSAVMSAIAIEQVVEP